MSGARGSRCGRSSARRRPTCSSRGAPTTPRPRSGSSCRSCGGSASARSTSAGRALRAARRGKRGKAERGRRARGAAAARPERSGMTGAEARCAPGAQARGPAARRAAAACRRSAESALEGLVERRALEVDAEADEPCATWGRIPTTMTSAPSRRAARVTISDAAICNGRRRAAEEIHQQHPSSAAELREHHPSTGARGSTMASTAAEQHALVERDDWAPELASLNGGGRARARRRRAPAAPARSATISASAFEPQSIATHTASCDPARAGCSQGRRRRGRRDPPPRRGAG